jgi:CRP-like cAMP-binding protein
MTRGGPGTLIVEPQLLRENRLLAALSPNALADLATRAPVRGAIRGQAVYLPGERMDSVTFPLGGLFSLAVTDPLGSFTSIATVGREGAIELAPALGSVPSPTEITCLIDGEVAQVDTEDVRGLLDASAAFRTAIFRYMGARFVDCVTTSACHRLHPLEARLARCLLTSRDRIELDEFPCTHEQLAGLLGASRPRVTRALANLQQAGIVFHQRGSILILDPAALEAMTCGCYTTIRNAFLATREPGR